jgi:hypothetical protein
MVAGGGVVKTTENKIHWPPCLLLTFSERGGSEGEGAGEGGAGEGEGVAGAGEGEGGAEGGGEGGAEGEPGTCISFSENKNEYKTSKGHHLSFSCDEGNST